MKIPIKLNMWILPKRKYFKCFFGHKWEDVSTDERIITHSGVKGDGWYESKGKVTKMRVCLKCENIEEWVDGHHGESVFRPLVSVIPEFRTGWHHKGHISDDEKIRIDRHIKLLKLIDDK
jgi:hypothetical protein